MCFFCSNCTWIIDPTNPKTNPPSKLVFFVKGKSSKVLWMVQKSQTTTMGCIKTCVSNGINRINYQPQLVSLPDFSHQSKVGHDSAAKLRPFTINWTTSSRSTWFPSRVRSKISRLSDIQNEALAPPSAYSYILRMKMFLPPKNPLVFEWSSSISVGFWVFDMIFPKLKGQSQATPFFFFCRWFGQTADLKPKNFHPQNGATGGRWVDKKQDQGCIFLQWKVGLGRYNKS